VQTEYVLACEILDEEYPTLPNNSPHGDNIYTFGRIGHYTMVIACLPRSKYGLTSAVSAAKDIRRSFPLIWNDSRYRRWYAEPETRYSIR
jgi:hypothetical protein